MKAIVLTGAGLSEDVFEFQEVEQPKPGPDQVLIKVSHFGLNYADVMARRGLYNDRPPLPCILGYEVVGIIEQVGESVSSIEKGDFVLAFSQFGGYAEYCVTEAMGTVVLAPGTDPAAACALATQYCTAWFSAEMMVRFQPGDRVLIHAAAGGVGTALVQIAKWRGCEVFGTAGNDEKLDYLKELGVDHPINYRSTDFVEEVKKALGSHRLDVAFDPIGGANFKRSFRLLGSGGRIVTFGASEWSASKGGLMDKIKLAFGFGFLHPIGLLMKSRAVIGVNMLRIGENRPDYLKLCMEQVYDLYQKGVLKPKVDSVFEAKDIQKGHERLEGRGSLGKIVMKW